MRQFKFRIWDENKKEFISEDENVTIRANDGSVDAYPRYEDGFVIQQFTGLLDKNKKEIYEGDIIERDGIYSRYLVKYNTSQACWTLSYESDYIYLGDFTDLKVVGNLFETPELLK